MKTYIVKPGDTLYGISNQFGVSVTDLANLNNVKANTLQIGEVLLIPNNSGTNPSNMFNYIVKKGDSLYSIAKVYNTTVDKIVDLNNLKSTNLAIGQVIIIPEMYNDEEMSIPNYINYTVKRGDTLYNIAQKYDVSVDTIIKDNSLISNNLNIGQNLKIRINKNNEEEVLECFGEDYEEDVINEIVYTVKKGDSLYNIAKKYNTSVSAIMNLNNLKNTNLSIGMILKIPSSNSNEVIYIVKKGDNLYSIARMFNTTVEGIKRKNNLKSNLLSIGQKLII